MACLRNRKKASLYQTVDLAQQYLSYVFVIGLGAWDGKGSDILLLTAIQGLSIRELGSYDAAVTWSRVLAGKSLEILLITVSTTPKKGNVLVHAQLRYKDLHKGFIICHIAFILLGSFPLRQPPFTSVSH